MWSELEDMQQMRERFEQLKEFDSMVFVEIPQRQLVEPHHYRNWLVDEVETKWRREYNQGNKHFNPDFEFNKEWGIQGYFSEVFINHCKFYRYDGTLPQYSVTDFRAKRGFLIRDHYSKSDVVKVHLITDNLVAFLEQESIVEGISLYESSCDELH